MGFWVGVFLAYATYAGNDCLSTWIKGRISVIPATSCRLSWGAVCVNERVSGMSKIFSKSLIRNDDAV